ncbi:MAG TPA: valine--tRNA ligase, partial [Burkholderiales bacterium]|nr:valine--tRNA ligase [Burkholderiales bacterium]
AGLRSLARLGEVKIAPTLPDSPAPVAVVGEARLMLYKAVDPAAEAERISKEITRVSGEIAKCRAKLANPSFVERAPAPVVEQERRRLADFEELLAKLQDQLRKLRGQK